MGVFNNVTNRNILLRAGSIDIRVLRLTSLALRRVSALNREFQVAVVPTFWVVGGDVFLAAEEFSVDEHVGFASGACYTSLTLPVGVGVFGLTVLRDTSWVVGKVS